MTSIILQHQIGQNPLLILIVLLTSIIVLIIVFRNFKKSNEDGSSSKQNSPTSGNTIVPRGNNVTSVSVSSSLKLTASAELPWDTKESIDDYAKRVGLPPSQSIKISSDKFMEVVLIPAGTFIMGSPEGEFGRDNDEVQHEVTLRRPYYMGITPVTREQFYLVGGFSHYHMNLDHPMINYDIQCVKEFMVKLGEIVGGRVRLPTEAEWEWACRAGSKNAYCSGNNITDLYKAGWYYDIASPVLGQLDNTKPVGKKGCNAWGLYDMHGNVWEVCSDFYADYPTAKCSDPIGPIVGEQTVMRGGSWYQSTTSCRSSNRGRGGKNLGGGFDIGFRFVIELAK